MQIALSRPDLEQFVEERVKSGEYPSPEAVVEEALVRLQEQRDDGDWTAGGLREAVHVGLDQLAQGKAAELKGDRELDDFFDGIKRAGRERLAQDPTGR